MIFVYDYDVVDSHDKTNLVLSLADNFKGNDSSKYVLY